MHHTNWDPSHTPSLSEVPASSNFSPYTLPGGPGSVQLRFGGGTVRAVSVLGSGSSGEGGLCVSVQFNREDGPGCGS